MGSSQQQQLDKMKQRQNYRNVWHTDLLRSLAVDCPYFSFALFCAPCASYLLRKRALYNDMSRYVCCAGYMPCSGSCGESKCPELCLCTETQHKVEMDKRDGKFGPVSAMQAPPLQQMSRIDVGVPPPVGYAPSYPPPAQPPYGQPPYGQPPYQQQPYGYPPQAYPAQGYPSAYPPPDHYPKP